MTMTVIRNQWVLPLFSGICSEALEFAEEQELSLEMMGRVRRALRRIEDAGGAGVMEGALSTMTEEDIEKFRMERDERHAKAANPRYITAVDFFCSHIHAPVVVFETRRYHGVQLRYCDMRLMVLYS